MHDHASHDQAAVEIPVATGRLRATLIRPASDPAEPARAAVLICAGLHVSDEDNLTLLDELSRELAKAGIVAATYEPRCADLILDDFHAHTAQHDVEDAVAALDWLARQPGVDAARLGMIGFSLGAIAASALASQRASIRRLCLIGPATAADVAERMVKANGVPAAIDPERLPAAYVPSLEGIDSPAQAAAHDRATLLVHGAADRFVPVEVAMGYQRSLHAAARRCECVLIARASHAFPSDEARQACIERVCRFFNEPDDAAPAKGGRPRA